MELICGELKGYGYGCGDGCGDGSGYGYGYGSGSGSGSGCGDGSGYGSGSGYGYGYGSGSGSGYGYGDGYGDGSGSGSGYGGGDGSGISKQFRIALIPAFAKKIGKTTRISELQSSGATLAFWKSDQRGAPSNGGSGAPVKAGDVQEVKGPLRLCTPKALHATYEPEKWQGSRTWLVALIGEVADDGEKIGALKREIIGECI